MLIVFLKFLLAHIIGDFVLQTKSMVTKRKNEITYLLLHVIIHAALLTLFFVNELQQWWQPIVFILSTHLAIDSLKVWWEKKWPYKMFTAFVADQALHLLMIGLVITHYSPTRITKVPLITEANLIYSIAILLIVFVTPVFMRIFFSKWDKENAFSNKKSDTLMDAGLVIGILERAIIVLFIQVNFLAGIGFLIGAKSIFRFGDLTNAKNTKFTEYILIGTFLSFTLALVIGFGLKLAIQSL